MTQVSMIVAFVTNTCTHRDLQCMRKMYVRSYDSEGSLLCAVVSGKSVLNRDADARIQTCTDSEVWKSCPGYAVKTRAIQIVISPYEYEFAYDMTVSNFCVASAETAMIACDSHSQPQTAKRQFWLLSPIMGGAFKAQQTSVINLCMYEHRQELMCSLSKDMLDDVPTKMPTHSTRSKRNWWILAAIMLLIRGLRPNTMISNHPARLELLQLCDVRNEREDEIVA